MTRIIIVRHAEAEGNVKRLFHGWTDSSLTQKGIRQARVVAERLKDIDIDCIYSSDLKRAYDTASFIAEIKELDVFIDKGLREMNGGDWEDLSFDLLAEKWPEEVYNLDYRLYELNPPNGEKISDFFERMVKTVLKIISDNKDKNICIVTHGTALKVLMCYFYNRPIEEVETIIWADNTAISIVTFEEDKFSVELDSDSSHLDAELGTLVNQDWWKK